MAGTVTVTKYYLSPDKKVLVIKAACVGDSTDSPPTGAVPATALSPSTVGDIDGYTYDRMGFYLTELWVVDGTPAPDAADVTLKDTLACQLYTEASVIPTSGTKQGSVTKTLVTSAITMTVANQATVGAKWDVYVKLTR